MPGQTSGLQRDIRIIRKRAWLFIPFFLIGVLISFALGNVAGKANAVASLQLETVVHEVFLGGDRGFRIFEAQSMTGDEEFKQKVLAAIGDSNFNYGRFSISLTPISVADGVARGTMTVSIKDDEKSKAETYRQKFVDVFGQEYTSPDGLFRRRYIEKRTAVAETMDKLWQTQYKRLKEMAQTKGITAPLDQIAVHRSEPGGVVEEMGLQEAEMQRELAEVKSALDIVASGKYSAEANTALAATTLKTQVTGDPRQALGSRKDALETATASIRKTRADLSDGAFDDEFEQQLNIVRALDQLKVEAYGRLVNSQAAVVSAESTMETSYSFSGGLAGTLLGRAAVVLAVTIVFGLIAIYTLEWLSQVRAGTQE